MKQPTSFGKGVSWATGVAAFLAIVATWHALHLAGPVDTDSYRYTSRLHSVIGVGSVLFYTGVSMGLGWVGMQSKPLAFGMVTPWLVALVVEVIADSTSHNLFPFEILTLWVPAFVLSYYAARVGRGLRHRAVEQHVA